jgi:hypothetical protein
VEHNHKSVFFNLVANSKDLHYEDKLKVLEFAANEFLRQDDNLCYLETRYLMKELYDER